MLLCRRSTNCRGRRQQRDENPNNQHSDQCQGLPPSFGPLLASLLAQSVAFCFVTAVCQKKLQRHKHRLEWKQFRSCWTREGRTFSNKNFQDSFHFYRPRLLTYALIQQLRDFPLSPLGIGSEPYGLGVSLI